MKPGLKVRVTLAHQTFTGEVATVAAVTGPAGWWNGNTVRYDTIVKLPSISGVIPGMSAEVEVTLAAYRDVLTLPVAAIVDSARGAFCWVRTAEGTERRTLALGDTNDRFTVVESGLEEGDEVVLHPFAFKEARTLALLPSAEPEGQEQDPNQPRTQKKPKTKDVSGARPASKSKPSGPKSSQPSKRSNKKKPVNSKPITK
jgi:hypothetical protein